MLKKPQKQDIYSILEKNCISIYLYIVIKERYQACFMSVKIFENGFLFIQGDTESDLGQRICLRQIVSNTVYDQFQKQPLWLADKRVELYGIRLDSGDISLTIQQYGNINGISISDMVSLSINLASMSPQRDQYQGVLFPTWGRG